MGMARLSQPWRLVAEMAMTFRAVVVDIGGVLEHNPPTGWIQRWEQRLGLGSGELAAVVSPIWREGRIGRASLEAIERRTAAALGLDARSSAHLWDDVWAEYLGVLNEDLLGYVSRLRPRFATAILSNSFVGARQREQERYGFQDHFDAMVYSHEEGVEKPASEFYLLACDRLAVAPEAAVFVDDLSINVQGAERVGMTGVLFESADQVIDELDVLLYGSQHGSGRAR